jgi:uncharacterized membrane protein YagU involved in acid resistance
MNVSYVIEFLLFSIVAGVIGTGGMTFVMYLINKMGVTNARMVIAIGSILTKTRENAIRVGLIMHFTAGTIFAILYTIFFSVYGITDLWQFVGVGFGFGFIHGFIMSFILVIAVAEHHPLEEFRDAGFPVAIAHVLGHIVYGTLVGLVIGLSGILN